MKKPLWINIGIRKKIALVKFSDKDKGCQRTRLAYYKIIEHDKRFNNYKLKKIKSTLVQDSWY